MSNTNKIKILSPEQAIKIAAGEVVERPCNIIKELVENSIDAEATKITIFLEQAGKKLLKIIDNGCGMSPEDARACVLQHATSKINTVEDLETITTFGFRGEALASINAVSKLQVSTKTDHDQVGTKLSWHFGILQHQSEVAHQVGTTIEIENLFENIPARQKFLKKDETELRAIIILFQAFCLDYQHIHFQLYHEHKLLFNCPPTHDLHSRIAQLFDYQFQKNAHALIESHDALCTVSGIIADTQYHRYDRNQIFIFVNHRFVKNIDLTKAVMKGYAGTLPPQKYPAAIIYIKIAPEQVDINIHPKKEEVKFLHPKKIENLISQAIKQTLGILLTTAKQESLQTVASIHNSINVQNDNALFRQEPILTKIDEQEQFYQWAETRPEPFSFLHQQVAVPISTNQSSSAPAADIPIATPEQCKAFFQEPAFSALQDMQPHVEIQQIVTSQEKSLDIKILGQYHATYIVCEKDHNLVLIDQHAAHERILYEEFKRNFRSVATIQLMFPEIIKLTSHDIITLTPYLELLHEHGINIEIFSETQILIKATPVHVKHQQLSDIIAQYISWIVNIEETEPSRIHHILHEKIHAKMACSAAIKAGDQLNFEQMQELLQTLSRTEHRFSCPHGRPTFSVFSLDLIEKQFKRDYAKKAEQFYDFL